MYITNEFEARRTMDLAFAETANKNYDTYLQEIQKEQDQIERDYRLTQSTWAMVKKDVASKEQDPAVYLPFI